MISLRNTFGEPFSWRWFFPLDMPRECKYQLLYFSDSCIFFLKISSFKKKKKKKKCLKTFDENYNMQAKIVIEL